ncbi:unnamed protein product [Cuscuta epithymum]|uniref:GTP cyclohydrolase 1 n=1 Tax=Cuscuta epithymum TaxID=186058 RepID=A0AAV0ES79_9ASTE|nr:unnamed protein product [Cuscuta epithymum]
MGALVEEHYSLELDHGTGLGDCIDLGFEDELESMAIEDSVRVLLQCLGEDINREGLRKTPFRVAKALREGTKGYRQKVNDVIHGALFPEVGLGTGVGQAGGAGGLVIVRDIDLFSYCESCLLPFQIKCHVGYVPSEHRVVGLSKLSRVADIFAKRLQNPQRLCDQVCGALQQAINPTGVALLLQCSHLHLHHGWVKVQVTSGSGVFEDDKAYVWSDFLCLLKLRGICLDARDGERPFCPSKVSCKTPLPPLNSVMTSAVGSILQSLGEDPFRKELLGTPTRFVKWFMDFKNSDLEMEKPDGGLVRGLLDPKIEIRSEVNLTFWSQCEHHLLPFYGVVHIGYLCCSNNGGGGVGVKPMLQSIVHFHGYKLQVQERLTRQIAESVASVLGEDVMVIVEASHTCMISRGIEKVGSNTATVAVLGRFSREPAIRMEFLQGIPNSCVLKENSYN